MLLIGENVKPVRPSYPSPRALTEISPGLNLEGHIPKRTTHTELQPAEKSPRKTPHNDSTVNGSQPSTPRKEANGHKTPLREGDADDKDHTDNSNKTPNSTPKNRISR